MNSKERFARILPKEDTYQERDFTMIMDHSPASRMRVAVRKDRIDGILTVGPILDPAPWDQHRL